MQNIVPGVMHPTWIKRTNMIFSFVSISVIKSGSRDLRSMSIWMSVEVMGVDEVPTKGHL